MSESITARKIHQSKGGDKVILGYKSNCHSSVQNDSLVKFGIVIPERLMSKVSDIETLDTWTKFLRELNIVAFRKNDELIFDLARSKNYKYKQVLFAWQLIRFGLTKPAFCRRILKIKSKLPNRNAWECIYLGWNIRPYKSISDYFTPFYRERAFEYIEFDELLNRIYNRQAISKVILNLNQIEKINIKDIKDIPLKDQIQYSKEKYLLKNKIIDSRNYMRGQYEKGQESYTISYYVLGEWSNKHKVINEQELIELING